ncbi:MAG: nucleotidyltransferase substrate binding protein [Chromatiaceae bacterium]|nr:nucleotidyltransferase substrate binding protein [Chromatiaceae bacterium]
MDIRWQQRFANYRRAFQQLQDAASLAAERSLTPLEQQGFIKAFEFTHELAWNVMKDYFEYQGNTAITGSRDAIREAFRRGLVTDGETWMETIASRNRSSHTYDENTARQLIETISRRYLTIFDDFETRMQGLADDAVG